MCLLYLVLPKAFPSFSMSVLHQLCGRWLQDRTRALSDRYFGKMKWLAKGSRDGRMA